MDVGEIIKDSLKYPFSDWKKFLMFGVMILFANIFFEFVLLIPNIVLFGVLGVIGFIFGLFVIGYMFKVIKSSLKCINKLPEFNNWINMGFEGSKVFIVYIVYLIPVILIMLSILLNSFDVQNTYNKLTEFDSINFLLIPLISIIWPGIIGMVITLIDLSMMIIGTVIVSCLGILYIILVVPIILVAIANMAYYEGELKSGFRIREIFEEISLIGWKNLIKWYVVIGILYLILIIIANTINSYISLINPILGGLIMLLFLLPYSYIFLARSVALFYMPDEEEH